MAENIAKCDPTENVYNYFIENAGPIFNHALSVFKETSDSVGHELEKETVDGLCTHLSLLCQMTIVAVAENVYTNKDPNPVLNKLNKFILEFLPAEIVGEEAGEETRVAEEFLGLLFDKAGKT